MSGLFVPVDGKGLDWPRKVANAINALSGRVDGFEERITALEGRADAIEADVATIKNTTNLGWIDYTDTELGTALALPAATPTQVVRTLSVTGANDQLRGAYAGHSFWENATSRIMGRGLYDDIEMSLYLQVAPGASGGVLDVQLMAGTIDIGSKAFEMTGPVGVAKGIRADFVMPVRSSFMTNGVKVMLTATVPTDLLEFSPEFYPRGVGM